MTTTSNIPENWPTLAIGSIRELLRDYEWNYIALSDNHFSDDEYERREKVLDERKAWIENRMKELESK